MRNSTSEGIRNGAGPDGGVSEAVLNWLDNRDSVIVDFLFVRTADLVFFLDSLPFRLVEPGATDEIDRCNSYAPLARSSSSTLKAELEVVE